MRERRPSVARRDLRDVDDHERMPGPELVDRAFDGVVVEIGTPQQPPGAPQAGDPGTFAVALVAYDHDAVDVAERALALPIGIAGKAASAVAALKHGAPIAPDGGARRDRSGEPADRLPTGVVQRTTREQPNVTSRDARGPQRRDVPPGGVLVAVRLAGCAHGPRVLSSLAVRHQRRQPTRGKRHRCRPVRVPVVVRIRSSNVPDATAARCKPAVNGL